MHYEEDHDDAWVVIFLAVLVIVVAILVVALNYAPFHF